jgi:release factor H-coupled RctB family protein
LSNQSIGEVRLLASQSTWIEGTAVDQLRKTAELPGMRLAVGLPDLHPGKGSPIGAAYVTDNWIYPTLVGNDIGCGIALWRTELPAKRLKREAWAERLRGIDEAWDGDGRQWLAERGLPESAHENSLGTIGGGNHFAELQIVESGTDQDGFVYLCVHSGSRGLGESILREHVEAHGAAGLEAGSEAGGKYLHRHAQAVDWAAANRELIASRMFERLNTAGERLNDVCHNSVEALGDGSRWIHRKGAAPSTKGPVVIPGSRGAFSYLVQPLDPREESAYSLAHGAGRKWSRSDSRARLEKRYSAKDLARTELGNPVICEDKALLYEEAPQAYKNITSVIGDLVHFGLIEVLAVMRPVVTYKVRR